MDDAKPTYYLEVQTGYSLKNPVPGFFRKGDVITIGEEDGVIMAYLNGVKMGPASAGITDMSRWRGAGVFLPPVSAAGEMVERERKGRLPLTAMRKRPTDIWKSSAF